MSIKPEDLLRVVAVARQRRKRLLLTFSEASISSLKVLLKMDMDILQIDTEDRSKLFKVLDAETWNGPDSRKYKVSFVDGGFISEWFVDSLSPVLDSATAID